MVYRIILQETFKPIKYFVVEPFTGSFFISIAKWEKNQQTDAVRMCWFETSGDAGSWKSNETIIDIISHL